MNSPYFEIVHIRDPKGRELLSPSSSTVLTNILYLITNGFEVHFITPGTVLDEILIPLEDSPRFGREIVIGGALFDPNIMKGDLIQCVNRRVSAWNNVGRQVKVDERLCLLPGEDYGTSKAPVDYTLYSAT